MNTNNQEILLLVDEDDNAVGQEEKLATHEKGLLHRAFSIFIFDKDNRVLLQQRALGKYHSGGLWANSCCGHPRVGEPCNIGAGRRLNEELGVTTPLEFLFKARYTSSVKENMVENELVYLFTGRYNYETNLNADEVMNIKWVDWDEFVYDITLKPNSYCTWLKHYIKKHKEELSPTSAA